MSIAPDGYAPCGYDWKAKRPGALNHLVRSDPSREEGDELAALCGEPGPWPCLSTDDNEECCGPCAAEWGRQEDRRLHNVGQLAARIQRLMPRARLTTWVRRKRRGGREAIQVELGGRTLALEHEDAGSPNRRWVVAEGDDRRVLPGHDAIERFLLEWAGGSKR